MKENRKKTKIISTHLKKMIPYGILVFVVCLLSSGIDLIVPYMEKRTINDGLMAGNKNKFLEFLIIGTIATVLSKLFSYVSVMLFNRYSGIAIRNIKSDVFRRMTELPMYIFSNNQTGYLHARLNETDLLSVLFNPVVFKLFTSVITMIGALVYLFQLNLGIFFLIIGSLPVVYCVCRLFSRRVSKLSERINESQADLDGDMQEFIDGAADIKQLNLENKVFEKVNNKLDVITSSSVQRNNKIEGGSVQTTIVYAMVQFLIVLIIGINVINNTMSLGDYVSVVKYVSYVFSPVILLSTYLMSIQEAIVAGKRIEEFFGLSEDKNEEGKILSAIKNIRLEDVGFEYDEGKVIFENMCIDINYADKINLCGENGVGKTTFIKLITGFVTSTKGKIYINNIPLEELNLSQFRKRVGILSQNSYLFSGTILENIVSTKEELKILKKFQENNFLKGLDLENGIVLENGKNLSSGQKQKIALARIAVRDPDVIIMDEGVTNLDVASKQAICEAIDTVFKEKICILISHSNDFAGVTNRTVQIQNKKCINISE